MMLMMMIMMILMMTDEFAKIFSDRWWRGEAEEASLSEADNWTWRFARVHGLAELGRAHLSNATMRIDDNAI